MICARPECSEQSVGKSKYCRVHRDAARKAWLEMIKSKPSAAERDAKWAELHAKACEAGHAAAEACKPTPMVVQQHANMLDDSSPVTQSWVVEGGPCGFAWVVIRPGNCSFARWAKKHARADKHYYGGVSIWCPLGTQSMAIKEAYCRAYATVLREAGIDAYAGSRLD
jgi:hypothetical protein